MSCVLFCVLIVISFVQGLPDVLPRSQVSQDAWTLLNMTRACEEVHCQYSFILDEGQGNLETCVFSTTDQDAKPASQTNFTQVSCLGLSRYTIDGRYHDTGVLVLGVSNHESNKQATFDFVKDHINYHPRALPQTCRPQPLQQTGNLKRSEKKSLADAPNWTVRNVLRRIRSNSRIWLGFRITSKGYDAEWCYMLVHAEGDPTTAPFVEEPCVGSNFTVSWGYMAENDGGIMTLLNPQGTRSSWFGWDHVNSAEHLDDVGPNATEDVSM